MHNINQFIDIVIIDAFEVWNFEFSSIFDIFRGIEIEQINGNQTTMQNRYCKNIRTQAN